MMDQANRHAIDHRNKCSWNFSPLEALFVIANNKRVVASGSRLIGCLLTLTEISTAARQIHPAYISISISICNRNAYRPLWNSNKERAARNYCYAVQGSCSYSHTELLTEGRVWWRKRARESANARYCWSRNLEDSSPLCITSCRPVNSYRSPVGVYSGVTQSKKKIENFFNVALRFSSLARGTLYRKFVRFWSAKFSSGGLGASLLYSDSISRKAKVTKHISWSYHMVHSRPVRQLW
jgi:hypothetical protein